VNALPCHLLASLTLCLVLVSGLLAGAQDSAHVFGDSNIWHRPPSRTYHVENYKLTLHFDEPKGEVFGDEVVTLRPFQPHFHTFYLHSSQLSIDTVTVEQRDRAVAVNFRTEEPHLWITLDHEYDAARPLRLRIVYHGFPRTGLFFVNPTPEYPNWPQEVYSQGETEFNRFWFPCWDYPNDMSTSETITTVPEGQTVVSNGKLVSVTHSLGQVTYDWAESVPHSSYLVSIAIGPWHKFSDKYNDKPIDYYVPVGVGEETARRSFHLTPDMIAFFSRASGVDYPYEKYSQTTVQNFIFGGQENVSATTLTDGTLHDERADRDYPSTTLVAHELGQQWFGDYVQGRDWANIWLNEGFATYMTALYAEHHEGYDAYRFEICNDQMDEQAEDRENYRRPIVDRHYADPLDMLDVTTHQKGAAVLDMLRYVVDGSEAASRPPSQKELLFRAFHHYLVARRTQPVDTAELINSIRRVTGMELGWFFREWVFMAGRPEYQVEAHYDLAKRVEHLTVTQTQLLNAETPVFEMPIEIAFHGANGERKTIQVRDHLARQDFEIPLAFEPRWVSFDPDNFIDKTLKFDQPVDALIAQAEEDSSMMSRLWAAQQLANNSLGSAPARVEALGKVLSNDAFYGVRQAAATSLGSISSEEAKAALLSALQQPDSRVRTAAVGALSHFLQDEEVYSTLVHSLRSDSSYSVEAAAAKVLGTSGRMQAFDILKAEVEMNPEIHVMQGALAGLAETRDPRAVEILLMQARPGLPERIRLAAIVAISDLKDNFTPNQRLELREVVRAALRDPFFLTQEAGERLVGTFKLIEFEADIQAQVQSAPTAMQRDPAEEVLKRLHRQPKTK
jgi:aminopeptidase N